MDTNNLAGLDPGFIAELRTSGVSLNAVYLGSVPVEVSPSLMVAEMRSQVISESIKLIASSVGACPKREINKVVSMVIGNEKLENYPVDINITTKMVKIIRKNRLLHRHPITTLSFGARGDKETDRMFGYIAKNKNGEDRRCHVVSIEHVQKLIDVLAAAISVSLHDAQVASDGAISMEHLGVQPGAVSQYSPTTSVSEVNLDEDVAGRAWYHGNLSRDGAQAVILRDGDFLIRKSDRSPGKFVLSGMTSEREHKHLALLDTQNKVRTRDRVFLSISELIEYHMNNRIAVRSKTSTGERETAIFLTNPIQSPKTVLPTD